MAQIKRMLALLLALIMVFSLGDVLALADGAEPSPEPEATATPEPEATATPEPETTEEPVTTEEPAATEEPVATDEPVTTDEPLTTDEPVATEGPVTTEEPLTTEEPEATVEPTAEPEQKIWPWTEPGNAVSALMAGGWTLEQGGSFYYSENGLYLNGTLLASVDALNLNLMDGWLYYTAGSEVYRMSAVGGAAELVHSAAAYIDQMYVMGQEVRYLAGGCLYSYDMNDGMVETLTAPAGVVKFIPTPYGNLFLTGSLFNYTLWAEQLQLRSGITNCYTDGSWLVLVIAGETLQTSTEALFDGVLTLQSYSLHQDQVATISAVSEDQQLAREQAYLESAEYAAIQASLTSVADNGIMTVAASSLNTIALSANQENIVLRAKQMAEVKWTAQADLYAWGGNDDSYISGKGGDNYIKDVNGRGSGVENHKKWGYFLKGHTYKGVPYSQAVSTGYVGWNISLNNFLKETNTVGGKFYSSYSTYERRAPYYGSDCSGFASYAWDLPKRCTCSSILPYCQKIGTDINSLQVGDVINNPSCHVMVVTYVGYNSNGSVASVEITEQTPPKMLVTMYGAAVSGRNYEKHNSSLSALSTWYLRNGYSIYRRSCTSRSNVNRPEDVKDLTTPAAPSISTTVAGPGKLSVKLSQANNGTIYYTTDGSTPTTSSEKYTAAFEVSGTNVKIRAIAVVDGKESFMMAKDFGSSSAPVLILSGKKDTSGVFYYGEDQKYYVQSGSNLSLMTANGGQIYYALDKAPTVNDNKKVDASTKIPAVDNQVIQAFSVEQDCIPSAVVTFKVGVGTMHTITVDDPYGFVTPSEGGEVYVLDEKDITFKIQKEIKKDQNASKSAYTLEKIVIDGETFEGDQIPTSKTFESVKENHSIKTYVQLNYTDLTNKDGSAGWYVEAVAFADGRGLMNGTSTNKFSPTYGCSRAMFITVLGRYAGANLEVSTSSTEHKSIDATTLDTDHRVGITNGYDINVRSGKSMRTQNVTTLQAAGQLIEVLGSEMSEGSLWFKVSYDGKVGYVRQINPSNGKVLLDVCNFSDITAQNLQYCNGYVQWAYINDLVNGVTTASFGATNGISRQDICVILYKYLTEMVGLQLPTQDSLSRFKDKDSVADYAKTAVSAMVNIGVVQGDTSGNFAPTRIAQRSQVAQMFLNLDEYMQGKG